jgi:hypothetical protein
MTYNKRRKIVRAFTSENYTTNEFPDTERKKCKKKAAPFSVALFLELRPDYVPVEIPVLGQRMNVPSMLTRSFAKSAVVEIEYKPASALVAS